MRIKVKYQFKIGTEQNKDYFSILNYLVFGEFVQSCNGGMYKMDPKTFDPFSVLSCLKNVSQDAKL